MFEDRRSSELARPASSTSNITGRGLCVLGVVALVIALLTTYDFSSSTKAGLFYVTAPELGGRPVFSLGPGCGHVLHTMGFVGRLFLEDNETRAMMWSPQGRFSAV